MSQDNSLEAVVERTHSLNPGSGVITHLVKVSHHELDPLALERINLIFEDYCRKGIYKWGEDNNEILKMFREYKKDLNSTSYLLFDFYEDKTINGRVTATYNIDKFQNLPSYKKGYWREEDVKNIIKRKESVVEGKVAEISKFASKTEEGQNSSVNLMGVYEKIFSDIKEQTDHILVSVCGKDLKHYTDAGLGEAFEETRHSSDKLRGKEVVAGYIGLSNMETRIHKLLRRRSKEEMPKEDLQKLMENSEAYNWNSGNPLWNCF